MLKKFIVIFLGISIIIASGFNFTKAVDSANLVLNPSMETPSTDGKSPQNWQTAQWGTNTVQYNYLSSGAQNGSRSVKTTINSFSSGDAKWYFTPIVAKPGIQYYFSDYYKSSTTSEVVVRYMDISGSEKFQWLGTEIASSIWKKTNYQFIVPSNVTTMTVYHLINSIGFLQTDNYMLRESESIIITDNVANNSFEQTNDGTEPLGWRKENWGSNTAQFTYLNTGHTGTHSGKVQITKYTDGDAKWGHLPITAIAGGDYRFTNYYQSNITTKVVVRITKTDGTDRYLGLPNAEPSTTWKQYSEIFTIPIDAAQITVLHIITGVGYLVTDDYSVLPTQIHGFNRGLVSLTFDDGWEDNYTSVLPILNQHGFKSTQYYATTYIKGSGEEYKIKAFADAGNEIGSHTITHPYLTKLNIKNIDRELLQSKQYLEGLVGMGKVTEFASPYGDYNSKVIGEIQKYYRSHRSTDEGYNSKDNFNIYNIRVQNMTNTTSLAQYQEWLRNAQEDNTWLVIIYHRVGDNPDQFETAPTDFSAQMQAVSQSGLAVRTVGQALDEILPQLN